MHSSSYIEPDLEFIRASVSVPNQEGYRSPYTLFFVRVGALVGLAQVDNCENQVQEGTLVQGEMLVQKEVVLVGQVKLLFLQEAVTQDQHYQRLLDGALIGLSEKALEVRTIYRTVFFFGQYTSKKSPILQLFGTGYIPYAFICLYVFL